MLSSRFYVDLNEEQETEKDDDEKIRCSIQKIRESAKNLSDPRTSTIKSNYTLDDYDTPPESPGSPSDSDSLNSTLSKDNDGIIQEISYGDNLMSYTTEELEPEPSSRVSTDIAENT